MSETTAVDTDVAHDEHQVAHLSHGLSDKAYWGVAAILAFITALEVAWSYLPMWDDAEGAKHLVEVGGLLLMMAIKFVTVAAYFMHLKFDKKILTYVFYAGLLLATGVYLIALTTFHIFW